MRRFRWLAPLLASAALACGDGSEPAAGREVPVRVASVGVDRFNSPVVVLEEENGSGRVLPIWIGSAEASSIASHIHKQPPPRPNFHDLAQRVIQSVEAKLVRVVVTELRGNTYYATLLLQANGKSIEIDVRPSDAIAVAVRLDAPILVREALFDQANQGESGSDSGLSVSHERRRGEDRGGSPSATRGLKL
jgi:hypothetical protein